MANPITAPYFPRSNAKTDLPQPPVDLLSEDESVSSDSSADLDDGAMASSGDQGTKGTGSAG